VKGTVEEVKQINQNQGWGGIHLTVRTEQGNLNVHVGPSWFLEKNKMSFEKGDTVEITGSKVKFGGEDALIAREIKKNGVPLTLRNAQGIPVWAGGPRANY
jgi:DNA/RNA endonuclease YhcR with UshA esterase domain